MPRRDGNKKFKKQRKMNHYRPRPGGKIARRLHKIKKFNKDVASIKTINSLKKEMESEQQRLEKK